MSSTNAVLPEKVGGVHLSLEPGYNGAIRAVSIHVASSHSPQTLTNVSRQSAAVPGHWRRAIVTMYEKKTRRIISCTTFVEYPAGKMTLETSGESVWRYTSRNVPTALNIRIEDKRSGDYKPSKTIRPVTVRSLLDLTKDLIVDEPAALSGEEGAGGQEQGRLLLVRCTKSLSRSAIRSLTTLS